MKITLQTADGSILNNLQEKPCEIAVSWANTEGMYVKKNFIYAKRKTPTDQTTE